ncbi:MAG TPA: metallophosphoesterase, partial [Bacillus bacterium]|nr:metallophosphoesterase [Bacillus sp. (in: firmicutes)]
MNLNKIGSVIGIFLVLLLVWGLIEPYFIDIQTEQAAIKNLPVEWEGKKVAVFGDFQVGMWLDNTATVNEAAEEIASLKPDAVLIIGDFIYHSVADRDKEMEHVEELIRPLTETGIPIFAVLGNHDFDMDLKKDEPNEEAAQNVVSSLKAIGITVLHNKAVPLKLTGENRVTTGKSSTGTLYIAGLGAAWP